MAYEVIMPKQGLQMTEGTLIKWLVREGEHVEAGAPLFEMETDKLTITIDAPKSGTLLRILRGEGDTVPVAQVIALIGESGEPADAPEKMGLKPPPDRPLVATPAARTLAAEKNVDLTVLHGTGPDGLVILRDVESAHGSTLPEARAMEPDAAPVSPRTQAEPARSGADREAPIPSAGMPVAVGPVVVAQASHRAAVDMTALIGLRESLKARSVDVSFTDLFICIVSRALMEYPTMNAPPPDEDVARERCNMGVAVSLPAGFAVPVIRDAHRMPLARIAAASAELIGRARQGALRPDECEGGTFTLTDVGMFDVDESTAVVNPREHGILALGKIRRTPVAAGDEIVIRPVLVMNLSYDHRLVDGVLAARFLERVRQLAENPLLMLL